MLEADELLTPKAVTATVAAPPVPTQVVQLSKFQVDAAKVDDPTTAKANAASDWPMCFELIVFMVAILDSGAFYAISSAETLRQWFD